MQVHNANMLLSLPEKELFKFDAIDTVYSTQYTANAIYQADKTLLLKPGCRVMLLSNVSDTLRNGVTGVFVGAEEEHLVVEFDNVGRVAIRRETWEKRSRSGSVVASRRQFPLSLVYGITCHKSQSLTLPAAVVHCSKEFTPGLVYVKLSRVKTSQHLQVLNFSPDQLLQPSQDCLDVCVSNQNMGDSTGNCCAQIALAPSEFTVDEAPDETMTETDEENSEIADITDKVVKAYFNRKENDDVAISDIQTDMETWRMTWILKLFLCY